MFLILEDFNKQNTFHRVLWDHAIDPKSNGFIKLKESSEIKKVICAQAKFTLTYLMLEKN